MEPEKPQEPIGYETLWGEPPEMEDDYLLEQIVEEENDVMSDLIECCLECGQPLDFCQCY